MQASEKPFKDYWTSTVYTVIKDDYERLLQESERLRPALETARYNLRSVAHFRE